MTTAVALIFLSGVFLCVNRRYGWGGLCLAVALLALMASC
jgi:hypothetical protein